MNAAPKPYDLTFDKRPDYLYVCIAARLVTPAMAFDYLAEIADKCGAVRTKRLLIERDVPVELTAHALTAVDEFVRMSSGLRIAFVNSHTSVGASLKQLIETRSAEGSAIAHFTNIPAAEKWLLE